MAGVAFEGVSKVYPDGTTAVPTWISGRRRGVHGARRAVGLRQDDGAPHGRRPRGDHRRRAPHRRPGRQPRALARPRHRDGLPELRALSAPLRLREHRLRARVSRRFRRPRSSGASTTRPASSASRRSSSGSRARSPAASGSALPWAARSSGSPQAFLMDEPLSNLDAKLRVQMRAEIARLQHDLGVTTVYVTHDQVEAMTMGDRVAVMRKGELQQVDEPQELYDRPVNLFVGGFIGSPAMNMLEAKLERPNGHLTATAGSQRVLADETIATASGARAYAEPSDRRHPAGEPRGRRARARTPPTVVSRDGPAAGVARLRGDGALRGRRAARRSPRTCASSRGHGRRRDPSLADEAGRTTFVGRFDARSRVREGERRGGRGRHPHAPFLRSRDGSRDLRHDTTQGGRMTRFRLVVIAVCIAALAAAAAATASQATQAKQSKREAVSGSVSIIGIWTGPEQKRFQAVLNGFKKQYPNVSVKYTSGGDNTPTILSTAIQGGNPPDLAVDRPARPAEGLRAKGALKPITSHVRRLRRTTRPSWLTLGTVKGKLYGLFFKGANKSTVWYSTSAFKTAGRRRRRRGRRSSPLRTRSARPGHRRSRSEGPTAGRSPTCSRTSTSDRPGRPATTS